VTDLATLTAAEMAAGYRVGRFSPVDVIDAALERIAAFDPKINAVVYLDAADARRQAEQAHRAVKAGVDLPLVGIPVGVKDIIDVAGVPTTCHSRLLLDNTAAADAEPVRRLRDAGAIVLCKLATHEFALGGPSFDLPFPPARNPWNTDHNPGGSSSGSGAAVAAGFVPIALGTDTAGSIRHPAGACGVFGLKPTYDAVSRQGTFPLAPSLDHVGPLARHVGDLHTAFGVMAGRSGKAPSVHGAAPLRIGYVRHFHSTDIIASADVANALDRVADRFADSGLHVEEIRLPPLQMFLAASRAILFYEAYAVHAHWLRTRPEGYGTLGRQRLMVGAFLEVDDLRRATIMRDQLGTVVEEAFGSIDVLLTANMMEPPCRIDDAAEVARTGVRQARAPFNGSGHPALSICTGYSSEGLPLSAQLVGRHGHEDDLFNLSELLGRTYPIAPLLERSV
jgi:aspartyl-tRNA(Asn)/glutamyl-tRNA(Gln) amidotransferase subunit A